MNLEEEKLKIQRTQLYLQMLQVALSATLIYFLISSRRKEAALVEVEEEIENEIEEDEE